MKILRLLTLLILVSTSCKANDFIYLKIYYLPEGLTTQFPVNCDNFESYKVVQRDTLIEDSEYIENLFQKIVDLKPYVKGNESSTEIRIRCEFVRKDNSKEVFCCGEFFGTLFNGQRMIDDKNIIEMIKQKVYK